VVGVGRRQSEFGEQCVDVVADRFLGDHEVGRDGIVGAAFGHQPEHVTFPWREGRQRIRATQQHGDDLRVQDRAAGYDRTSRLSPDYGQFEAAWIADHAAPTDSTDSTDSTAAPRQDRPSQPITPPSWYESPGVQGAAILLFLVAFAGYPLIAAVRRLLGHRRTSPVARPARWLAATGLATVIGVLGYLFFLLATAANIIGIVVLGRPAPWLALQILAVSTVVATIVTAVRWRRHRRDLDRTDHLRLGLLVTAGFAVLPWGLYWGLLTP
jgi:uncharacterized protein